MENSSWQKRKRPSSQTSGICIVLLLLLATYSIPFCHEFFKYYSVYCVIGLSGRSAGTETWTYWRPSLAPQISWNRKLSRLSGCYQVAWAVLPNIMSMDYAKWGKYLSFKKEYLDISHYCPTRNFVTSEICELSHGCLSSSIMLFLPKTSGCDIFLRT